MRDHRPQTPATLLDNSQMGNIQQRAIALSKLDKAVKAHLNCAEHCRVSNYRQGVLIIETASAAWSMRLNYERNTLMQKLREKLLPNLSQIDIRVNPALAAVAPAPSEKTPDIVRKPISDKAAGYLRQTAADAPDKIKARLERIAAMAEARNRSK
ncbi:MULTISPECIES: DUF721 domain-containing protein [Photobacterium]|uniref:DUF721 domain-containing protein n=1 Tax=Photobacterium ganghwense TaxID=320778 RepID=A0A0J1H3I4_9GAMM|nr:MULTISPECIES: DciA family protein [Photobacterium]KLV06343.1 hypothetical protein ABT57_19615 [Photobacterium ganghwense]MBV1840246.1 DUF721 domain-containing protein [Photobacterium ganghwense]PSU06707.1 DUF721 domain-containing protein [Photobacterium ganghwense]QSV14447.1 DUF721 domain-containing protein [Photobacterium ganghwense]